LNGGGNKPACHGAVAFGVVAPGFTIHQVFERLKESEVIEHAASGRDFGSMLFVFGLLMLLTGIVHHVWCTWTMRKLRSAMGDDALVHGESPFPPSMTLVTAQLLLVMGMVSFPSMILRIGPFQ
jgi:putative membrane protein